MKGHFFKPNCKCEKGARCKCGATWSYIVDIGMDGATGKRRQKKKGGFKTKADAEAHLAQLIVDLNNESFVDESSITFAEFADDFIRRYESTRNIKKSTLLMRKNHINYINQKIGKYRIKDLTRPILQKMVDSWAKTISARTIVVYLSTLKLVIKKAIELDVVKSNQTQFLYVPKTKSIDDISEIKYIDKTNLKRFLEHTKNNVPHQDYLIFLTLAYTGMRIGELAGLKWSDIDFENQTISINRTITILTTVKNYLSEAPKTKSSKRKISIDNNLIKELLKHKAEYNIYRMSRINNFHNEDFVFISLRYPGYPISSNSYRVLLKKLLNASGLPESLTLHSFRHTHTSLLAEAGVSLEAIMERLGHKDDAITRHVYLHITESVKKDVAKRFADFMDTL